ncbi:MAG: hypothetical protein ACI841_003765 [Planctomycetota bacterium]|jgi:hypothetical protein
MKTLLTLVTALAIVFASPQVISAEKSAECCSVETSASSAQEGDKKTKRADAPKAGKEEAKVDDAAIIKAQLPFYPVTTCVISGEALGDSPANTVVNGRLVRTCCTKCARMVAKDPERIIAKLDEQVIAAQTKNYPFESCIISDEALDSMGGPLDFVHEGRLVRVCCKGCVKSFTRKSDRYFAKINAAMIKMQKSSYKLTTCVVSGELLADKPNAVDHLHGDKLVRLCCGSCVKVFKKTPDVFMADMK